MNNEKSNINNVRKKKANNLPLRRVRLRGQGSMQIQRRGRFMRTKVSTMACGQAAVAVVTGCKGTSKAKQPQRCQKRRKSAS
jgi:hypothetical protein